MVNGQRCSQDGEHKKGERARRQKRAFADVVHREHAEVSYRPQANGSGLRPEVVNRPTEGANE
jgi:hypothetical protein